MRMGVADRVLSTIPILSSTCCPKQEEEARFADPDRISLTVRANEILYCVLTL